MTEYEFIRGKVDPLRAKALLEEVCAVLPLDNRIIGRASEVWRELRRRGEIMDDRDLLIGVTAIVNDLPLWTGNRKHFDRLKGYGLRFWDDGGP